MMPNGTLQSGNIIKGSVSSSNTANGSVSDGGSLQGRANTILGRDGKSAYELAVKHGFEGTEEEWLESLKGKDGKFEELTEEQKATLKGDKGETGTSVTHSWNGTVLEVSSASGTSSANLKGEKGNTGNPGVYLGSGEMPDDCNVQIDSEGEIATLESIAEQAAALVDTALLTAIGTGVLE